MERMERQHLFDRPENVRRLLVIFFVLCGVLLLLDVLQPTGIWEFKQEPGADAEPRYHLDIEGWFGFYGVYGFGCCVALVMAAKVLRKIVMRGEDYYDR